LNQQLSALVYPALEAELLRIGQGEKERAPCGALKLEVCEVMELG
jgi:hypothetical protein